MHKSKNLGLHKGKICKICDSNFIMLDTYNKFAQEMDHLDYNIEILARQYYDMRQDGIKK